MSANVLSKRMGNIASELIEVALEGSPSSLRQLDDLEQQAMPLIQTVADHRTPECYPAIPSSIRLLSSLACLPSLQTMARGKPQGKRLAERVYVNYQLLHNNLFTERSFILNDLRGYDLGLFQSTVGAISETAILGTLWWGLARGKRSRNSYTHALPTTKDDDNGKVFCGEKTGVDIKLYNHRSPEVQSVQVKTRHTTYDTRPYIPEITLISIDDLTNSYGRKQKGTFGMVRLLAANEVIKLDPINNQIDTALEETQAKLALITAKTRPVWKQQLAEIGASLFSQSPVTIHSQETILA